jgi:hypothetical protein
METGENCYLLVTRKLFNIADSVIGVYAEYATAELSLEYCKKKYPGVEFFLLPKPFIPEGFVVQDIVPM